MSSALYLFKIKAQQWREDPYYVASSAPFHKLEVIAGTLKEAREEARRVLGPPESYRYWKLWIIRGKDIRLIEKEKSDA